MQPLNKDERRKAFWNFLMLFLVSILIITTTIFFSIQVPFKQNNQLMKDKGIVDRDREFSDKFMNGMLEITAMLDSINIKADKPELLDGILTEKINKLNLAVEADSVYNKALYKNIVITLADFRSAKKQLRDLTGKDINLEELQKQKEDLSRQLESTKMTLNLMIANQQRPH